MSEELLPCPFCGATDIELSTSGTCSWAVCAGCGAEGPWHNSVGNNPDSARTLWNTRPALIDHLEADGGVEAMPHNVAEACRLVEYDMINRQTGRGQDFVGHCGEVATIINYVRALPVLGVGR